MAIFEKELLKVIAEQDTADLSKATLNKDLSAVGYNNDEKLFYSTLDKVLFSDPVSTIKTVLAAHGYVTNLENILSCLDSFVFSAHGKVPATDRAGSAPVKVKEYLPSISFGLPQKNRVGDTLQSFYDEIAKYESRLDSNQNMSWASAGEVKKREELLAEIKQLKTSNKALQDEINALTFQLSREQKSLSRASRALDSQQVLPDNTKICRVERVDLKRRVVKVKSQRKQFEIPTHILDWVPNFQARCLVSFEGDEETPIGMILLNHEELDSVENRTAELLCVDGETFKARDSMRNEFQIKAVNPIEASTIRVLRRGMRVVISIAGGYVVRFAELGSSSAREFTSHVQEQLLVYDIARNQLIDLGSSQNNKSPGGAKV